MELDEQLSDIQNRINQKCQEIPHADNILEISGIGENILSGTLAEMCDISRFDDVKEIKKLSGLGHVACSSGKLIVIACKLLRVIYTIRERNMIKKDVNGHKTTRKTGSASRIIKARECQTPDPCWIPEYSEIEQGSGKKPDNDGVQKGTALSQ